MGDHDHQPRQDRTRVGGLGSPAQSTPAAAQVLLRTGAPLSCLVCGGQAFARREVKLNTSGMSFLGLDWANRSGDGAVCRACGFVHTFLDGQLTWGEPTT
jgi:hypothetical protein